MTYCDYIKTITGQQLELHKEYHDNHYGFPIDSDEELFERLMFEINQADIVAGYGENEFKRLMNDEGIIRNRLKINAAIENAKIIQRIRSENGSFRNWLDLNDEKIESLEAWTKLFRKTFKFTGGEIVNEFLMSTGYLQGAHSEDCPVYVKIKQIKEKNEKR